MTKPKHRKAYMECAEAFAKCSNANRSKVGCVIVKGSHIISEGYNGLPSPLSGSLEGEDGKTLPEVRHAEENAMKKLMRSHESCDGAEMYVTHAPCYFCSLDIVDAGIISVYFKEFKQKLDGVLYLIDNGVFVYHEDNDCLRRVTKDYIKEEVTNVN